MRRFAIMAALASLVTGAAAQAGDATPLFAEDSVIEVTISGPIGEIARNAAKSTEPKPATLSLGGESHLIALSVRGHARRRPENCRFPPLRVKFSNAPAKGSLFHKQKTLKLVTHCRPAAGFQKHYLLEYSAYKMYNSLTPESFRVRLANVRYVEEETGKLVVQRTGFFIEDVDDLADRVDMDDVKVAEVALSQYDAGAAARAVLFNYMIANHDWSMFVGPEGECCHNGKLLGATGDAASGLVYVPFDFDYSGFVDAPYAAPPEAIKIASVRERYYRGACALNGAVAAEAATFRNRKSGLLAAATSAPGMDEKTKSKAQRFLEAFFKDIADAAAVEKLLKRCR